MFAGDTAYERVLGRARKASWCTTLFRPQPLRRRVTVEARGPAASALEREEKTTATCQFLLKTRLIVQDPHSAKAMQFACVRKCQRSRKCLEPKRYASHRHIASRHLVGGLCGVASAFVHSQVWGPCEVLRSLDATRIKCDEARLCVRRCCGESPVGLDVLSTMLRPTATQARRMRVCFFGGHSQ